MQVKWIVGDIGLKEDAEKLIIETINTFGRLDVLVIKKNKQTMSKYV